MPVELWLSCICDTAKPSEVVVAVGAHPALGGWHPAKGAVLTTTPETYPCWRFAHPLRLAEDPDMLPSRIEFKYMVRDEAAEWNRGGLNHWEDLGMQSVPTFRGVGGWEVNAFPWRHEPRPVNRQIYLPPGHGVVIRRDRFGNPEALCEASWCVSPHWGPDVAGGEAAFGPPSGLHAIASWPRPKEEEEKIEVNKVAMEVFVYPKRAGLLAGVKQLTRKHRLPGDLWELVLDHIGGDVKNVGKSALLGY